MAVTSPAHRSHGPLSRAPQAQCQGEARGRGGRPTSEVHTPAALALAPQPPAALTPHGTYKAGGSWGQCAGWGYGPEEKSCVWGQGSDGEGCRLCLFPVTHASWAPACGPNSIPHTMGTGAGGKPRWCRALPHSFLHQAPTRTACPWPGACCGPAWTSVFSPGQWAAVPNLKERPHLWGHLVYAQGLPALSHPLLGVGGWAPRPREPRQPHQQASLSSAQALARVGTVPSLSAHCP